MAAGNTYEAIATTTLTSDTGTITFSSIPQTYTDLVVVMAGTWTGSGVAGVRIGSINGDTGANYSNTLLQGNGSTVIPARDTSDTTMNLGLIGSVQTNSIFHFMNYSNTTTYKTVLSRGNDASAFIRAGVGLWRNTAAITSFTISNVTFSTGTSVSIYGIKAA